MCVCVLTAPAFSCRLVPFGVLRSRKFKMTSSKRLSQKGHLKPQKYKSGYLNSPEVIDYKDLWLSEIAPMGGEKK